MKYIVVTLQLILGIFFAQLGFVQVLAPPENIQADFINWGYPLWFVTVVGIVELIGGAGMILGLFYPLLAALSGLWLGATMIGAILTHLVAQDGGWPFPLLLLLLCIIVARMHVNVLTEWIERMMAK